MDRTSVWQGTADKSARYPSLQGDLNVDVAIVGAGITGLTAAMLLSRAGKRVAVLEDGQVGSGTSSHSTGNLYAPVDVRLHALEQQWGADVVRQVVASRAAAVDMVERTAASLNIDCGFTRCPWYLFATHQDHAEEVRKEYETAQRAGLAAALQADLPVPLPAVSALRIGNQAQFQPLDYLRQLAQRISGENCLVFENTPVREIEDSPALVHTDSGTVRCGQVLIATHTPIGIHLVQSKLDVVREYGVALHIDAAPAAGVFWGLGDKRHSIRAYSRRDQSYLVVVGAAHPTGKADDTAQRHDALEEFARQHFAAGPLAYRWSAQRYRGEDKLPYIGRNVDAANTFIATGFSGDGLTYGTLAGMLIADQMLGKANPWTDLYRVDRLDTAKRAKGFEKESTEAPPAGAKPLAQGDLDRFGDLGPCQGRQEKINGEPVAAYRNDRGELMVVSGRCTHMGCGLKWNAAETSWDCPCHGSRFTPDGKVLEGPAIAPLERLGAAPTSPTQPHGADNSEAGDEL
jgi:glycine/D-amino acid oxidase-like deaminating enzyme/nitrite reductase/ring-hydroxylating ferredoxin subunit